MWNDWAYNLSSGPIKYSKRLHPPYHLYVIFCAIKVIVWFDKGLSRGNTDSRCFQAVVFCNVYSLFRSALFHFLGCRICFKQISNYCWTGKIICNPIQVYLYSVCQSIRRVGVFNYLSWHFLVKRLMVIIYELWTLTS